MKVICELEIGNNQTYPGVKVVLEGDPMSKSGFVHLRIGEDSYELRPTDIAAALQRTRSDA